MENREWISVNDHLPKHLEVVMIPWRNSIGMRMAQFMEHAISKGITGKKNFFCKCDEDGFTDTHYYNNVRAWLPLPKPAKEFMPKTDGEPYADIPQSDDEDFVYPKDKYQTTIGDITITPQQWYKN